jgi:nucleoside-diphosphate-sugar epimerase
MPNLSGKTALVTGASRGIGRASALALAAAGAQVLVHYGRGATEADGVVAEIGCFRLERSPGGTCTQQFARHFQHNACSPFAPYNLVQKPKSSSEVIPWKAKRFRAARWVISSKQNAERSRYGWV